MNNEMIIHAIVVLYNKKINDSVTLNRIFSIKSDYLKIYVIDNSINDCAIYNLKESKKISNLEYFCMHKNLGISKAYNFALSKIKPNSNYDLVLFLDDDTNITAEFIKILYEYADDKNNEIMVPYIYGQDNIIYSPNEKGLFKGKYIKDCKETISESKFNAINSCLAVRLNVYSNYKYDEELFMDCVDTKFFDDMRNKNKHFSILPIKVKQNFFQHEPNLSQTKLWKRFKGRIKDTMRYSKKSIKISTVSLIKIFGWACVYGFKVRSITFFFKCTFLGIKLYLYNIYILLYKLKMV